MILVDGNAAAALGATFGGVQFMAWYPITPSSSLAENTEAYLKKYRKTQDGHATFAVVQAEDELAAIGMTVGAGWAGGRAMTATSGPGISLMAEFAGLAYFAEVPIVVWDVQRVGPSTGLPTRTSQADILFIHFLGHGDTRQVVLFPTDPAEAFEFGWKAFDIAERLQTPVFVLSDLDLGMNLHTSRPFHYPDQPMDRGKVLTQEDLDKLQGDWGRYRDVDGDGIGYRTLPGNQHPNSAYFARGTGHNANAVYSENPDDWEENMTRLHRKLENAREMLPPPVIDNVDGAKFGIISLGTNDDAIRETRDLLKQQDIKTDYLRIRALPAAQAVKDFIEAYDYVYVVENNFDGQLAGILRMDMPQLAPHIRSVARNNGLPLDAEWIRSKIMEMEG
jgi:2-oxoglutarate ferredoxin oxidoreductase subunit alpha